MTIPGRSGRDSQVTCLSAMTGHCHAAFGYGGTPDSADRGIARPTLGCPARPMLMPGLPAQPVIYFAIGRRQVTMTDCNEQSVSLARISVQEVRRKVR